MFQPIVGERQCTKCLQCKPLPMFGMEFSSPDGYRRDCKECRYAQARKRYAAKVELGIKRKRGARKRLNLSPVPRQTPIEADDCVRLRNWRGPVSGGLLMASL